MLRLLLSFPMKNLNKNLNALFEAEAEAEAETELWHICDIATR